jgi:peroxiredoxin
MAEPGELLPDVALTDRHGQPWLLSSLRGRPVVLVLHRHLA